MGHPAPSISASPTVGTIPPLITTALVAKIADEADADARSVTKRLAGLPVAGRAGRRIDAVLKQLGLR
jgi:hypothetical protein